MQITIDTDKPLTVLDRALIEGLLGDAPTREVVTEPAEKPAPAKRATPAKKAEPKSEPEPEPEDEDDDLVGGDEDLVTKEQIVDLVTELAANGQGRAVKALLTKHKVAKVNELTEDKYPAFMAALQAL